MKILVTGAAGFIGFHLTMALLERGDKIIGIDNLNNYYDPALKQLRLDEIAKHSKSSNFEFIKLDIANRELMEGLFASHNFDVVVNLAAQAGVRYSLENPHTYVDSNLVGFINILEGCRSSKVKHLVFASSSSIYGGNLQFPFHENDRVDHPISYYAATKKSNELMAHAYSHLFKIPMTGLRFFTVYGPWGRPDMSLFLFTKAILSKKPLMIFNNGNMFRDFTYIDDIVDAVIKISKKIPKINKAKNKKKLFNNSLAPYKIFNIGGNKPINLKTYIGTIEKTLKIKAIKKFLPMQSGDVKYTHASLNEVKKWIGFKPKTKLYTGIKSFVNWYKNYYKI